jgi:hypothetical protein
VLSDVEVDDDKANFIGLKVGVVGFFEYEYINLSSLGDSIDLPLTTCSSLKWLSIFLFPRNILNIFEYSYSLFGMIKPPWAVSISA